MGMWFVLGAYLLLGDDTAYLLGLDTSSLGSRLDCPGIWIMDFVSTERKSTFNENGTTY